MILYTISMLAIFALLYIVIKYYVKPKRRMNYYRQELKKLGYRVFQLPFKPFAAPYFEKYQTYFESHGDGLYIQKHIFRQYDVILSNVLDTVCLTIENLQLVKKFYDTESVNTFVKHPQFSEGMRMTLGQGIVFSQRDVWKRKRKIISKAFNYQLLIKNILSICKITDETISSMNQEVLNLNQTGYFQFQPKKLGFRIFSRVMLNCFFGAQFKNNQIEGVQYHEFLSQLLNDVDHQSKGILVLLFGNVFYKFGLNQQSRKLKLKISKFQNALLQIINQKVQKQKSNKTLQQKDKNNDLIQILMAEQMKGNQSYDIKQLLEEFCTFLVAGTQTTTNFLNTIVFYLCKYPQVQQKLRKQIEQNIKSNQDFSNIQKLKKLNYLDCVQNQIIRVANPAPTSFIRISQNDTLLKNIYLKKGTGVFVEPFANHFNQKYFQNPFEFRPQRWIEMKNNVPYSFTGFFGGPRTCIGKHLAYLQSKIVLIKLLISYKSIQIKQGGDRMEVKFFYGPQSYKLRASNLKIMKAQ